MPAPAIATSDGSMWICRCTTNPANTSDQDERALHEQLGIADRFAFVQRHDVGDPLGIGDEEAREQARQHRDEGDEDEQHRRAPCWR